MTPVSWTCPAVQGGSAQELALAFDQARRWRVLIVPALFDEANRMRRFTVDVMRRLDGAGIDCFLPDLPGCNESLQGLEHQTPESWQAALQAAARAFGITHVLAIRGGNLVAPYDLPVWRYAPVNGASILRQMLRARILAAREAGQTETQEDLLAAALAGGIELVGYRLGAAFVEQFQSLTPPISTLTTEIAQDMLGGSGLWLRAEPGEDRSQADALAAIVAIGIKA